MAINFYDEIKKLDDERKILTENGAVAYSTTGKALLDMHFKVSSYRNMPETAILNDFIKAYAENPELAVKWMFYVGDVREGLGERRLFRVLIKHVLPRYKHLIECIGEYNRYDSLFELFGTEAEAEMLAFVDKQLKADIAASLANKPCSLLAKWMPSCNTSSAETRAKAHKFIKYFGKSERQYRKMLSEMRAYIDVVERKLCSGDWSKVDYQTVPSKANILYKDAFMKHDQGRRQEYLAKLATGEVKINASAVFPHDILHKYNSNCTIRTVDATCEAMWKALPNTVDENAPVLVVRDGSGSMNSTISGTSISALEVATALTVYFAEHTSPAYRNKFITFSNESKLVDMSNCATLRDKLSLCNSYNDCSNTNIEKVFDRVLEIAVKNKVKQEEIPSILIVSDMEFDAVSGGNSWLCRNTSKWTSTLFENIASKFEAHGYTLPRLIFWNVMSRTGAIPVTQNALGVALVSGFSQNTCKMIQSNELDPYKILLETLNSSRYEKIK